MCGRVVNMAHPRPMEGGFNWVWLCRLSHRDYQQLRSWHCLSQKPAKHHCYMAPNKTLWCWNSQRKLLTVFCMLSEWDLTFYYKYDVDHSTYFAGRNAQHNHSTLSAHQTQPKRRCRTSWDRQTERCDAYHGITPVFAQIILVSFTQQKAGASLAS